MPIGAHTALGFLAEPLKQLAETLEISDDHNVFEDLREFKNGGSITPVMQPTAIGLKLNPRMQKFLSLSCH